MMKRHSRRKSTIPSAGGVARALCAAVMAAAAAVASAGAAGAAAPGDLTVSEGFVDPIGFYDAHPAFSWKLPADGSVRSQSAYRVVVATDPSLLPGRPDLWDSGTVASDRSVWVRYEGTPLAARQAAYWQVKFRDEKERWSDWSETARFELGLLDNADWRAQWIARPEHAAEPGKKAAANKHDIVITRAVYGVKGEPAKQIDITKRLQAQVNRGDLVVVADNDTAGKDPAYGVVKVLELAYTVDGKTVKKTIAENAAHPLVPGATPRKGKKGKKKFIPEYLRREFTAAGDVERARLYVTAKGLYRVSINGDRVGEDCMVPGWTPYHARIETLTYDVTGRIGKGPNAIGAILGEGWYAGEMMRKKFVYPRAKPYLLLQLEIAYTNGKTETIVSDGTWKATNRGPIRYAGIYHGETYDAAREMPGWDRPGYDDASWVAAVAEDVAEKPLLVPKRHHPVRVTEILDTVRITEPAPGHVVFDMGQNMVGRPILKIPVEKGRQVTARVAEMLKKDGTLYTANYRAAKSIMHYTPAETGTITWQPAFTFFGYRYVELTGLPAGAKPEPGWVTGAVLHSAFEKAGTFTSSHAKLNRLQKNITWGQRGNYLDIPTDCPQRNERLGWTGDAQVFCATSLFNYDTLSFWMSWLQSVREEQKKDGAICHVVPETGCGAGSPGWGDVAVTSPWNVYVRTGHRRVLAENYDMMQKWTAKYEREAKGYIVNRGGFRDWLQPHTRSGTKGDTPRDLIATAYFGYCASIMQKAAAVLGRTEDAAKYEELHAKIRAAFSATFFDPSGTLTTKHETQTGYLMALDFDLLEPCIRDGAVGNLLELIEKAGGHLRTGFLGTPLIAFVLDREGHTDVAYEVLFKETYPSWFFSINQGATTMWERWNSYSRKDGFGNAGMNSFNHYAYGAIGQWMYERIAGLAPDPAHPGYKHFFIRPQPGGPLTSARAEHETPYGRAVVSWEKKGGKMAITAVVPPNTTATLVPPAGRKRTLQPGTHTVTVDWPQ